jgi:hypothetical protein
MLFFWKKNTHKYPTLTDFSLKPYSVRLPLDRLVLGTDNIRFDVHLSEGFCTAAEKTAIRLIARHANAEPILRADKTTHWTKERDEFKRLLAEIMAAGINNAKIGKEIQIDYLAQTAVIKALLQLLKDMFENFVNQYKEVIRIQELSDRENQNKAIKLKESLNAIVQKKSAILYSAGQELFEYVTEVRQGQSNEAREANFGFEAILHEDLFTNPMLMIDNPFSDFFMIEEYDILLGHRLEDPDKYEPLMYSLKSLFDKIGDGDLKQGPQIFADQAEKGKNNDDEPRDPWDHWMRHTQNIDMLFNYFKTQKKRLELKKKKGDPAEQTQLHHRFRQQKQLLDFFYQHLNKTGLIQRVAAYQEIKPIYHEYCPPLRPQQVLQFLISPKQRKQIISQLGRLKGYYTKPFILKPLIKRIKNVARTKSSTRKEYLLKFLKGVVRFHRDYGNYQLVRQSMENINIVIDEKILNLSRANNTLYEFLLPHEDVLVEKPIINHVIIKADVRGSTDITYQMRERGLNPASYFSLNYFDPITDILPAYGAVKVFIEGDAIILGIYQQKDAPGQWYNVARACGLAVNMLFIVQQYNANSAKYNLPILEIGIGICFNSSSPTFLFDGDQKIVISPAINLADRLSACSKILRRTKLLNDRPFNLYVFQDTGAKANAPSTDDSSIRYNINGIELNSTGFKKLSEEIDLKIIDYPVDDDPCILYTGKFPTVSGRYQQLIIREARIPVIDPSAMKTTGLTGEKYYEVCTHAALYEYVKSRQNPSSGI